MPKDVPIFGMIAFYGNISAFQHIQSHWMYGAGWITAGAISLPSMFIMMIYIGLGQNGPAAIAGT